MKMENFSSSRCFFNTMTQITLSFVSHGLLFHTDLTDYTDGKSLRPCCHPDGNASEVDAPICEISFIVLTKNKIREICVICVRQTKKSRHASRVAALHGRVSNGFSALSSHHLA